MTHLARAAIWIGAILVPGSVLAQELVPHLTQTEQVLAGVQTLFYWGALPAMAVLAYAILRISEGHPWDESHQRYRWIGAGSALWLVVAAAFFVKSIIDEVRAYGGLMLLAVVIFGLFILDMRRRTPSRGGR